MRKLEELLNLEPMDGDKPEEDNPLNDEECQEAIAQIDDAIDKIDTALPMVKDLDSADDELDDLAKLARDTFEDLTTLAMNVEPRYSGVIFQSASTILGHALTAKQAKIDKKLKMIDLQLKKMGLDQRERQIAAKQAAADSQSEAVDGKGIVLDRNELLKSILAKTENK